MLDFEVFQQRMTILADWYGKQLNEAHLAMYYRAVKDELTTERFQQACDRVFKEERFFPVPAVLIEKVTGSLSEPQIIWAQILHALEEKQFELKLDRRSSFALKSIGGSYHIRNAPLSERQWIKREFCEYWQAAERISMLPEPVTFNQKSLPHAHVEQMSSESIAADLSMTARRA